MKPFENVKWDVDAENHSFQEIFKKQKKSKEAIGGRIKKAKKNLKNIETTLHKNISKYINQNIFASEDTVNLVTSLNGKNVSQTKKKKHKKTDLNIINVKTDLNPHQKLMKLQEKLQKQKKLEKKSQTINMTNLTNTATSDKKLIKKKKEKLKKLQKKVSNFIGLSESSGNVNLLNSKKKKLKQSTNKDGQFQNSTNAASTEKLTKIERKKLKKIQKTTERNNEEQDETNKIMTKRQQTRLKKKLQLQNQKIILADEVNDQEYKKSEKQSLDKGDYKNKYKGDKLNALKNIQKEAVQLKANIEERVSKLKKRKKSEEQELLNESLNSDKKKLKNAMEARKDARPLTLRQKMMEKLMTARFRFINEQLYTTDSNEAKQIFQSDPESYKAYHKGYRKQVKRWPLNPLDIIINSIKKMPKTHIVADFGCGDARLSKSVNQTVHSFDLVAVDESVVACDMAKVPLESNSVDVAVFCLSLMGTNLRDYLFEANRVLKTGGILKVAEVESRFENVDEFVKGVKYFGFRNIMKDQSHNLFYFLDFKKERDVKHKQKMPTLSLLPCLYKKR